MRIATCTYRPEWHDGVSSLQKKLDAWVANAADQGADVLVFPEYAGCEVALTNRDNAGGPAPLWSLRMAELADQWKNMHTALAQDYGVWIVAGSLADRADHGLVNRAWLCGPEGQTDAQDKLILTPYERTDMALVPGYDLKVFDTTFGRCAILICYDSEFPLLARAAMDAGADMLIVPSATDFAAGQTRVRQSCRARAIEGQCVVVQAPVLGGLQDCDILDSGTGRAAVFVPPDYGLPASGIIAQGETDEAGWVLADIDLGAVSSARKTGQVSNFAHWPEQLEPAKTVKIRRLC